jgi:hypothetical protein
MPQRKTGAALAATLGATYTNHAAELARVADGGAPTAQTIDAAADVCRDAAALLSALPLTTWWQGWAASCADVVAVLCEATAGAELEDGAA